MNAPARQGGDAQAKAAAIGLIVNADDLGWSDGINAGIIESHTRGILTSATLAANMPAAEAALAMLPGVPRLGVGVHLNACQGRPLSSLGRQMLAGADGEMNWTGNRLIAQCLLRPRRMLPAIEAEFDAQIAWAVQRGLRPTHLDSHRHIHALPGVFRIVSRLCDRYHIRAIRRHCERLGAGFPPGSAKQRRLSAVLNWLGGRCRRIDPTRVVTQGTWGVTHTGVIDAAFFTAAIRSLSAGVTEIMVHPGYAGDVPAGQTRLRASREAELAALCDPRVKDALRERKVALVNYADVDSFGPAGR